MKVIRNRHACSNQVSKNVKAQLSCLQKARSDNLSQIFLIRVPYSYITAKRAVSDSASAFGFGIAAVPEEAGNECEGSEHEHGLTGP